MSYLFFCKTLTPVVCPTTVTVSNGPVSLSPSYMKKQAEPVSKNEAS